ncbi:MAG: glycosyltransferase [Chlorobiota bacterium]|nr:MAG: glycosyltransferase [Chlorobiota bacterium]
MELATLLGIVSIATYWVRTALMAIGAWLERRRQYTQPTEDRLPPVSIVVPARNEEHRIARCLESLASLDYPSDRLEIIVVDDRSTDRTAAVVASYAERIPELRVLSLAEPRSGNLRGKAGALDYGILHARGEIILLTDADCAVDPHWVHAHVAAYHSSHVAMVCAYTLVAGTDPFARFQAVEWNTTNTMASAGVYYRQFLGCFGNNMSIRREVYCMLGGYRAIPFSVTEDLALLQAVGRAGFAIAYLCSKESRVETEACATLGEYIQQHQRWVHGAKALGWRAYTFVATTLLYWLGVLASVAAGSWLLAAAIILARLSADAVLNIPSLVRLGRRDLVWWIFPTTLAFGFLELSLPFLALSRSIRWKDQVFETSPSYTIGLEKGA